MLEYLRLGVYRHVISREAFKLSSLLAFQRGENSPYASRLTPYGIGLAIALLYLWGLGAVGLQDPDEGMYAEIAREMLVSNDWVIPRFNGVPYLEKPPLMYWLTAGTYAVLGTSEFSARVWKILPTLGTIILTYEIGRRLFGDGAGILSALVLATTLGTFLFSRITQMDPLLVFAITLSVFGFVGASRSASIGRSVNGWHAALCFWIGIGIGMMSKGLAGLLLPLALLIVWTMIWGDTRAIRGVWSWGGIAVAMVLVLPWHVVVTTKVPSFLEFYLVDNQLLRFLGGRGYVEDGNSLGTLAFLGVTIYALMPWAPYLGAALIANSSWLIAHRWLAPLGGWEARRLEGWKAIVNAECGMRNAEWRMASGSSHLPTMSYELRTMSRFDSRIGFLIGWIVLVIGTFVVSSYKLEYYALPAFPAVALLVGAFIARVGDAGKEEGMAFRMLRVWTWVALIGGLIYTLAVAWAWWAGAFTPRNIIRALSFWVTNYRTMLEQGLPLPPVSPDFFSGLLIGGGLMWAGGFAAALYWLRRGRILVFTLVVALVGVGVCGIAASILRQVESHHSLKPLAARLNAVIQPGDVLVHERGLEKGGGLLFYTGRQVLVLNGTRGDLEFGSKLPEHQRTFIDTPTFQKLWTRGARVFLVTDLPRDRSAVSRLSDPIPIVLASTGTRWLYGNRAL